MAIAADDLAGLGSARPDSRLRLCLSFPLLVLLSVLRAVVDPAGITAREAMLPEAARTANWTPRPRQRYSRSSVGCCLGGCWGWRICPRCMGWVKQRCGIPAGLFVIGILAMLLVKVPDLPRPATKPSSEHGGHQPRRLRWLWGNQVLRAIAILAPSSWASGSHWGHHSADVLPVD